MSRKDDEQPTPAVGAATRTVLFVCEFNSCRSQMAEALARRIVPAGWRVLSAGLVRTVLNDEVVQALREAGVDAAGLSSKALEDVTDERVDEIVVLAAPAVSVVGSRYPAARILEWPMEDPVRVAGGPEAVRAAVRAARDDLARLWDWIHSEMADNPVGR